MTQNLKINDTVIEPSHVRLGTNGSVGVDRLSFTFSDGWDGLLTKATFYPVYGSPVEMLASGEVIVPPEMYKQSGVGKLVISGYAVENNVLKKRKYTIPCEMEIPNTIVRKGDNSIPETPNVYEQLRAQMQDDITNALQTAKDSGVFDGADGEAATVDVSRTVTLPSGSDASVSNEGTNTNARLVFGIPRGAKGDPGERGGSGVYVLEDGETTADIPDDANIALFPTGESITLADGRGISTIERTSGDGSSGSLDTYTITYTDNTTSTFSVRNGSDGQIFNIKGVVANTSALPTASAANSGDAYLVGTETPYLLYACVLSGGAYTWLNLGSISGVKGDKGDKGDTGTGITSLTGNAVNKGQGKRAFVLDIGLSDDTSKTFEYDIVDGTNGTNGTNGTDGEDGRGIVSIERTAGTGAAGTTDTYTITYSDTTTSTFPVYNGKDGAAGAKGDTGATGAKGADGRGIVSIERTSGNGAAGTVDTYTITYSDNTTSTFPVRNGADGTAAGITIDGTVTPNGTNAVSGKAVYDHVLSVMGDFNTVASQMETLIGG